jgi:protein-export membrane protein SecD
MTLIKRKIISPFIIFIILTTFFGAWFVINIDNLIKKGVDIVGGTYITLHVKISPLINRLLNRMGSSFCEQIKKKKKELNPSFVVNEDKGIFSLIKTSFYEEMLNNAIEKNIIALRKRIDPLGAGEVLIARNNDTIIIELPNVQDPIQARALIGTTAYMTIKPVIDSGSSKEELERIYKRLIGKDVIICPSQEDNYWYVLPYDTDLTGSLLKSAVVQYSNNIKTSPVIQFTFNSIGGQKFRELTKKSLGKQVAISIDDVVITAPVVNQEIGSQGIIQGNFTLQSAQDLATLLQAGSFEAPVEYVQERVIEPILGKQTIQKGLWSCAVGMILLLIASLFVYSLCGFIAFIVLIFNLLFTLVGIYLIGGTLTLSGIAGLILTIGMAIDASVLIFEKIKEELNEHNKNIAYAVDQGFSKTMEIIIDANITHFIVAIVLFYVGAGPLKGFALSMIIGIFSTIITGIFLLNGFLNYMIKNLGIKNLWI